MSTVYMHIITDIVAIIHSIHTTTDSNTDPAKYNHNLQVPYLSMLM